MLSLAEGVRLQLKPILEDFRSPLPDNYCAVPYAVIQSFNQSISQPFWGIFRTNDATVFSHDENLLLYDIKFAFVNEWIVPHVSIC